MEEKKILFMQMKNEQIWAKMQAEKLDKYAAVIFCCFFGPGKFNKDFLSALFLLNKCNCYFKNVLLRVSEHFL